MLTPPGKSPAPVHPDTSDSHASFGLTDSRVSALSPYLFSSPNWDTPMNGEDIDFSAMKLSSSREATTRSALQFSFQLTESSIREGELLQPVEDINDKDPLFGTWNTSSFGSYSRNFPSYFPSFTLTSTDRSNMELRGLTSTTSVCLFPKELVLLVYDPNNPINEDAFQNAYAIAKKTCNPDFIADPMKVYPQSIQSDHFFLLHLGEPGISWKDTFPSILSYLAIPKCERNNSSDSLKMLPINLNQRFLLPTSTEILEHIKQLKKTGPMEVERILGMPLNTFARLLSGREVCLRELIPIVDQVFSRSRSTSSLYRISRYELILEIILAQESLHKKHLGPLLQAIDFQTRLKEEPKSPPIKPSQQSRPHWKALFTLFPFDHVVF